MTGFVRTDCALRSFDPRPCGRAGISTGRNGWCPYQPRRGVYVSGRGRCCSRARQGDCTIPRTGCQCTEGVWG